MQAVLKANKKIMENKLPDIEVLERLTKDSVDEAAPRTPDDMVEYLIKVPYFQEDEFGTQAVFFKTEKVSTSSLNADIEKEDARHEEVINAVQKKLAAIVL